ncbi:MAG TPA: FtsX-like permease family protein [Gammaproteobacteria bacterium]|nr:FtsX-like permease family protein [Gammaproteobacteria bacterium]
MLKHYVAVALRNVRGAPFTSAVNLLTLAVGLVCFVTAYAFVTFWDSAEQHFPKAGDIYVLTLTIKPREGGVGFGGVNNATRAPDVAAEFLRSDYPAISKIARLVQMDRQTMVAAGDRAERLASVAVDAEFLDMFDLPFVAGDRSSAFASPRSVVITRDAANRMFGAENPIGKTLLVGNSVDATVTGVIDAIPEPSHLGRSATGLAVDMFASRDVYDALRASPALPSNFGWFQIGTIVYLYLPPSGGLSPDVLRSQLGDFVARHVPAQQLQTNEYRFGLEPVGSLLTGTGDFFDTGLTYAAVLLLLGGLVLGVACVNYANLATARAARRVREIGVRKALGASPGQIAVQSFAEAGAFAFAALLVALVVFMAAQPLVKRLLGAELDSTFFTSLSMWPALAALLVAVTLVAGAYPAFVLSRVRPVSAITVGQARLGSPLFSTLLVGTQFGVASFLLIALTVISMQNAEMRRTALAAIDDPLVLIANPARQTKVAATTLRERLGNVPQVRGVTEVQFAPWEGLMMTPVAGDSQDPTRAGRPVTTRQVGFDFFNVFSVPILAGRVFDRDHAEDAQGMGPPGFPGSQLGGAQPSAEPPPPTNIVVDRAFVAAFGLGTPEEAVDKLVYRPAPTNLPPGVTPRPQPPLRIIGVVEERSFSFFKLPANSAGAIYQLSSNLDMTVARVASADIAGGLKGIDAAWRELAPSVAVSRRFLDEVFEGAYAQYLRINRIFAVLSAMAFGICVAGLFGMAIFVAGRRRREIGVRKTLGASTSRMVTLLLVSFSRPVVIANLIAWPAGFFAARAYLNQFSQSIALTPWPFVLSAIITLAIACLAVAGQTFRAARTTPAEVLRQE